MAVPITALSVAFHALFNVVMAADVARLRVANDTYLGTGSSDTLLVAARRHGNHAEYVALTLVLMALAELGGGTSMVLHGIGAAFTLGRVMHAVGVGIKPSAPRGLGALFTWVSIATAGVYAALVSMTTSTPRPRGSSRAAPPGLSTSTRLTITCAGPGARCFASRSQPPDARRMPPVAHVDLIERGLTAP